MNKYNSVLWVMVASLALGACSLPSWMGGKSEEKPKLAGERIAVLPVTNELHPDADAKDKSVALPDAVPNDSWPQHGEGFSASNANLAAGGNFEDITHARVGRGEKFEHVLIPTPVVGGGLVYVMDQAGNVSAHEVANIGNVRWQYAGVVEEDAPPMSGGGLAYESDKIYVVSGRGMIAQLDAQTGKEIWRKALHLPFRSAPKVADGRLFAVTVDNQTYVLKADDGTILWTHRGINEAAGLLNSVSPTIESNYVIVPYSSGEVYVLSTADGKEVWSEAVAAGKNTRANSTFTGIGGDPLVDGGVVFAVGNSGTTIVKALVSGKHVWDRPVGSVNTPWIAGDGLFMITTDNTLLGMVKFTGKIRWATQLQTYMDPVKKKNPITWKGPVMVNGKLAVVGSNGQLLLVSAEEGKILSTQSIPENIYTAPVVAAGRMFLIGQDATLYSLK